MLTDKCADSINCHSVLCHTILPPYTPGFKDLTLLIIMYAAWESEIVVVMQTCYSVTLQLTMIKFDSISWSLKIGVTLFSRHSLVICLNEAIFGPICVANQHHSNNTILGDEHCYMYIMLVSSVNRITTDVL